MRLLASRKGRVHPILLKPHKTPSSCSGSFTSWNMWYCYSIMNELNNKDIDLTPLILKNIPKDKIDSWNELSKAEKINILVEILKTTESEMKKTEEKLHRVNDIVRTAEGERYGFRIFFIGIFFGILGSLWGDVIHSILAPFGLWYITVLTLGTLFLLHLIFKYTLNRIDVLLNDLKPEWESVKSFVEKYKKFS
jgi:hypothetical protein